MLAETVIGLALACATIALVWARWFYKEMLKADEGNALMQEIAHNVRLGARAYLRQQNKWVAIVFFVVTVLLSLAAYGWQLQSAFTPIAFVTGGFFSGLSGWFGMQTATQASHRTAAAAARSLNEGLLVAFRSGAVMGLTVVGLGLIYICLWFTILYWAVPWLGGREASLTLSQISITMLSFGMGASAQALFARVGGGIFTKAADVGADLVGKVEQSLKEDSPRNPATIADNVGDNVGDVAGMGADLYESYCGAILAAAALGVAAYQAPDLVPAGTGHEAQLAAFLYPIAIAGAGILLSIVGIYAVRTGEDLSQRSLLAAIGRGINLSTLSLAIAAILLSIWLLPSSAETAIWGVIPGVSGSVIVGLIAGWAIGKWTEYVTSDEYVPTRNLAQQAETGAATIIISGVASGMGSTWMPVGIISVAMLSSFGFACGWQINELSYFSLGLYGVGIAAVGMLSTLGITLATDAYGPIADNAGGNAEMSELEPIVRERTDALDSLGNTTAATGKGFAIGSAALTALALLAAYVESVRDGFDRWGNDFAQHQSIEGLYRLRHNFLVDVQTDRSVKYLVLHRSNRGDGQNEWRDQANGLLPASSVTWSPSPERARLAATDAELIPLQEATIQDFLMYFDGSLMNPRVLVGMFLGAMSAFLFCAMTMKSVGRAAQLMVVEVREQFLRNPGILDGSAKPDYERPVEISTRAALREMIMPSLLGLLMPIAVGIVLGVGGVLGLLAGCLSTGFCLAIFMSNSGGTWDNAKKYIEAGNHGGKGGPAHKAAVVGDTVGDPFKDTSGPSLNILIKLMSMVSVVVAGIIVRYSLVAMGWL